MSAATWTGAAGTGAWPEHHRIGSYEVIAVLRASDTGYLYAARDPALGRTVMLEEFLPPALAQRDSTGEMAPSLPAAAPVLARAGRRFMQETRVLSLHEDPRLARVLHVIEAHGTVCRVMPAYAGRPLADLLAEGRAPRDEASIRTLLSDLLAALETWQALAGPHGAINARQVLWLDNGHAVLLAPDGTSPVPLGAAQDDGSGVAPPPTQALAVDLQAVAALARACMKALPPEAPATATYSAGLLQALEATLSPDPGRWPVSVAQFRTWLEAPPAPMAAAAPPSAVHLAVVKPLRQDTAGAPDEQAAAACSSPPVDARGPAAAANSAAAGTAQEGEQVDAATSDLIRRVVDSVPDRDGPARPAAPQETRAASRPAAHKVGADKRSDLDAAFGPIGGADRAAPRPPARRRRWLWTVLVLLAVMLAGVAAALVLRGELPLWPGEPAGDTSGMAEPVERAPPTETRPATPAPGFTPGPSSEPDPPAATSAEPTPVPGPEASTGPADPTAPGPGDTTAATPPPADTSPRQACGDRTRFALYRCMQQQCEQPRWRQHPQCLQLQRTDQVPE